MQVTKRLTNHSRILYFKLSTTPITEGFFDLDTKQMEYNNSCELPVDMFCDTLQSLNLSNNMLDELPDTLCELKSLGFLDLSKYDCCNY